MHAHAKATSPVSNGCQAGYGTSINSSSGCGQVAADQLSRMFPTPPSLDPNPIASPSDMAALCGTEEPADNTPTPLYSLTCASAPLACAVEERSASPKRRMDVGLQTDANVCVAKQRRRDDRRKEERWTVCRLAIHASGVEFGRFGTLGNYSKEYRISVPTPNGVTYQPAAVPPYATATVQRVSLKAKDCGPASAAASAPSLMTPGTNCTSLSDPSPSPFAARTPKTLAVAYGNLPPAPTVPAWPTATVLQTRNTDCELPVSSANGVPLTLHSLVLNLALYDSLLNLFTDRNFDACTICACNMNAKGNSSELELYVSLQPETDADETPAAAFSCLCAFSPVANRHRSLRNSNALFREDAVEPRGRLLDGYLTVKRAGWHTLLLDPAESDALAPSFPQQQQSLPLAGNFPATSFPHHLLYSSSAPFSLRLLVSQLALPFATAFAAMRRCCVDEQACLRVERVKRKRPSFNNNNAPPTSLLQYG